jgi:hypothetical protein
LHLASSNGHLPIVSLLVRKGVDVNPVDRMGGTPLSDAIREGHLDVTNFLRAHGAQLAASTEEEEDEFDEAEFDYNDEQQLSDQQHSSAHRSPQFAYRRHPAARYIDEERVDGTDDGGGGLVGTSGAGQAANARGGDDSVLPSALNSAAVSDNEEDEDDTVEQDTEPHADDNATAAQMRGERH